MNIFKKYEFDSQEVAEQRIEALGDTPHCVVKLGYLWIEEPTFDEEGSELTSGTQSDKYSVDVLWDANILNVTDDVVEYPYGWKTKEIAYDESWVGPNGAHSFLGWNFNQ